jgi:uncharacterized protein (TIGR02596 family)
VLIPMPLRPSFPRKVFRAGAFTLVELLLALAIVAGLSVVAMTAMEGTLSGVNLKGSANTLISELDLARETAGSRNVAVDVRLYQDSRRKDARGNPVYRIVALVIPASTGAGAVPDEWLGSPVALSGDVIIDSDFAYSSLLNTSASSTLPPVAGTESATAPFVIQNKPYVKFTFLPNGSLNLDSTVLWSLTLVNQNQFRPTGNGPASNFVTIVLDVVTGHSRIYQP